MRTLWHAFLLYMVLAYIGTPPAMTLHIWIHALYLIFPFEPKWLARLHDWSGKKL